MAAERTWLAWWRTALTATAGALAVGRLAPELLDVAPWPYILLGCGYAGLAAGMLLQGARRQRELERAVAANEHTPLPFRVVALFTAAASAGRADHRGAGRRADLRESGRGESNPHLWLGKPTSWPLDNARGAQRGYRSQGARARRYP